MKVCSVFSFSFVISKLEMELKSVYFIWYECLVGQQSCINV